MKTKLIEIAKIESEKRVLEFINSVDKIQEKKELYSTWWINQHITPAYKNRKDLNCEQLKEVIKTRFVKTNAKKLASEIAEIESIFASGSISEISVSIEWKNNRTWGANPTATAQIYGDKYEHLISGSISGCGYDKESTAFADAVNQSLAFRKLLYEGSEVVNKEYGHRYGKLSGGVGVSCYYRIFELLGYKMKQTGSGKMFNCYHITKM